MTIKEALVVIPTFNEIENIEAIIAAVFGQSNTHHVLIVDDGSPDGTAQCVKNLQAIHSEKLHLIERSGKLGLGTAYIAGFKYGIAQGYKYILEMDADFSHDPKMLNVLIQTCKDGSDIAVGSRYVANGEVKDWSMDRLVLSYGASLFVRMITWMPIKDSTAGFICYTAEVLKAIDLDKIKFVGYAFQIEMKYTAYRLGFKLTEVPIVFKDRELGTSKMNTSIVKEAIFGVINMRFRQYKRKQTK
jgi:dolichol-phosphate mannosyltransferase